MSFQFPRKSYVANRSRDRVYALIDELKANTTGVQTATLDELSAALDALSDERSELMVEFVHEHNNAFGLIKGYHTLLGDIDTETLTPFQRDALDIIGKQIERLDDLLKDSYDLARVREGQLELTPARVRLAEVLAGVQTGSARIQKHWDALRFDIPGDLPDLWADPDRLAQAITLLVVKVAGSCPSDDAITVRAAATPGGVRVSVGGLDDNIETAQDAAQLGCCYTAFTLALHLVDCMGGAVTVEQTPAGERAFCFTLPAAPPG
ncbi:MAG: HAMP domain-containing histidine kinase [Anaerolineae bacterium]|nr:HAMP domain-containing histidine kinase [Anaerolineae bacterium]